MTQNGLFPVSAPGGEIGIALRVRAGGRNYQLLHIFRDPSAADKKAFWGCLSRAGTPGAKEDSGGLDYLGANEFLYDRCILRVEGYELTQQAAGESRGWKNLVPLKHKLWP